MRKIEEVSLQKSLMRMAEHLDCQVEENRYKRKNNFEQTNYWILSKKERKKAPLIIFVHGAGCDSLYPQLFLFQELIKYGLQKEIPSF